MNADIKKVQIREVGPRDGLQNEKQFIPTATKIELIQNLVNAGVTYIEATAFVNPKSIPQMSDAVEVAKKLPKKTGVTYSALVPNEQGFDAAIGTGVFQEIAVFTAASETFNQKNINTSIDGSFERFATVMKRAQAQNIRVRGYVSTSFVCPYEGKIKPERVIPVVERLFEAGCYEVSIGDTIGKATTEDVEALFKEIERRSWISKTAGHFHDTYGEATKNVEAAMKLGVSVFDSSVGGLGGCPYAPGASGNLATEDLVSLMDKLGIQTGIDLQKLIFASEQIQKSVDHPLPSKVFKALAR